MAASFQDGSNPYGSFVMTTGGLGYVMESAEITAPTTIVEVKNATGEPSGLIAIPGFVTGRGTCQLATSTYPIPTLGAVFTYSSITYVISNVAQPYAQQDIQKVNVEFRKRLNS
jgi:hypothetical protein